MKIILLYTRHWTTDVGPLKWFGQNCTTELATIQQVCTRVYKLKLSCFVTIPYKALGEKLGDILNQFRFIRYEMFKHKLQAASENAKI